jgi:hypothetical protein
MKLRAEKQLIKRKKRIAASLIQHDAEVQCKRKQEKQMNMAPWSLAQGKLNYSVFAIATHTCICID